MIMEEKLISKKDLLIETGISYGQLYRWKRKNIIPEEWFIKKSTFTGQETFFPKDKIIERINLILSMKEGVSLDDIANMFTEKKDNKQFNIDYLIEKNVISNYSKEVFESLYINKDIIEKKELLILSIIEKNIVTSVITMDELKSITEMLDEKFSEIFNSNGKIYLYRKLGIPFVIGCEGENNIYIDKSIKKILEVDIVKEISNISLKLV
ncbi:YhbD family protein [Paraclostridium bifermentans]